MRKFWQRLPVTDLRPAELRTVQERREHLSAEAFVRGPRWYAKRLLKYQEFSDWRKASSELIQSSRKLIERSRVAVVRAKNVLAFSRRGQKYLA